jgi:hypothetical protein
VRSKNTGVGQLLRDWRRSNVAFTRARHKLVIIGSRQTLAQCVLCAPIRCCPFCATAFITGLRSPMFSRLFDLLSSKQRVRDFYFCLAATAKFSCDALIEASDCGVAERRGDALPRFPPFRSRTAGVPFFFFFLFVAHSLIVLSEYTLVDNS